MRLFKFFKLPIFLLSGLSFFCFSRMSAEVFMRHLDFVPSRLIHPGIPKNPLLRKSSYPFVSGDTLRNICDFIVDETNMPIDPADVMTGDMIFVNGDFLEYFFKTIHPKIQQRYILVTHNSIVSVPGNFSYVFEDWRLGAWFGKNATGSHGKLIPIPLGIANSYWPHGNVLLFNEAPDFHAERPHLLYLNIDLKTNADRLVVAKAFEGKAFCYNAQRKPFDQYLQDLKQSKFVISPEGAGVDCHRTWEALLMGCIPIIKHSGLDRLFKDLPVVIVDDWNKVDEQFLMTTYRNICSKKWTLDKLLAPYWLNFMRIKQHALRYKNNMIPRYFGVNFDYSMEQTDKYHRTAVVTDSDWQLAKRLYRRFVCRDMEYSVTPKIPKIIHQIWLGSNFPEKYLGFRDTWLKLHPDWKYMLWTEKEIDALKLVNKKLYDNAGNYGEKSDIARYEILYRFGGLYIDTDFECLKPFDILHHCLNFYAGATHGPAFDIFNGLMGCSVGNPILKECIDRLSKTDINSTLGTLFKTGPQFLTKCFRKVMATYVQPCVIFPVTYFYSWPWMNKHESLPEQIGKWVRPESMAIHYWDVSWNGGLVPDAQTKCMDDIDEG